MAEEVREIRSVRRETYSCWFEDGGAKVMRNAGDLTEMRKLFADNQQKSINLSPTVARN